MRVLLAELGEIVVGSLWWGGSHVVGIAIGAMLLVAPLILGNLLAELVGSLSGTAAISAGVVGAYALGLPPWDSGGRYSLLLVVGGTAVSAVAWDLLRGSADTSTLLVALALTLVGWPIRRVASTALEGRRAA